MYRRYHASASSILDLTGSIVNAGSTSLSVGTNSLLILPAGSNPTTDFASFSFQGLIHTAGTTLTVSAGQGFGGCGSIRDPVNCQGTITAVPGGFINLNNGLVLSGSGTVSLGNNGALTVNDAASAITSGSLSLGSQYVGYSGAGTFTQWGGTNTISCYTIVSGTANIGCLYLGYNPGDSGTYNLIGGSLSIPGVSSGPWGLGMYVGYSGTGTFTQSGGTNADANCLYLGYNSGSNGTYSLSGGYLSAYYTCVGYSGSGTFTQSGGTNAVSCSSMWDSVPAATRRTT